VGIGLSGGDNQQYVNFQFVLADYSTGAVEGSFGLDTYNWVTQANGETEWGTMTALVVNKVLVEYVINNIDGAYQCFNVVANSYYGA